MFYRIQWTFFILYSYRLSYKYDTNSCLKDSTFIAIVHDILTSNEIPDASNLALPLANFTVQFLTFFANIGSIISGYPWYIRTFYIGYFIDSKYNEISLFLILLSISLIAILTGYIKANELPLLDQYEYNLDKTWL